MKKVLLIGVIAMLAAWIYSGGRKEFRDEVVGTASQKTEIFN